MFEKGRDEIVKPGGSETIVGASVKLKGNLRSDGDILIEGVVTGDLKTKGSVRVGENANVIANVKAENVAVSGSVQGNVEVKDRLEISSTGRVLGDISANVLSIAPGAVFTGKCMMPESPRDESAQPTPEIEEVEVANEK